ncbi:SRSF2 [Branchiostoma lanceolatum]|uniref:Serine/arginine-rich splicing factor 2 n=1 Tax=Branchiostoma lanceolatum TaxID=7740 RepID=A0A8K0AF10_BRALA|nr:SRSF2 [Branchiostoma lanceolatum]
MSYGPPPPDIERMYSLKVDNLTYRTTPEDLRRVFEKYGDVGDCYIPRDRFTRESRGFAFVRFYDKRDAEDALDALDGTILDGREVRVQMARYGRPTDPYRRAPPQRSRRNMAAVRVVIRHHPSQHVPATRTRMYFAWLYTCSLAIVLFTEDLEAVTTVVPVHAAGVGPALIAGTAGVDPTAAPEAEVAATGSAPTLAVPTEGPAPNPAAVVATAAPVAGPAVDPAAPSLAPGLGRPTSHAATPRSNSSRRRTTPHHVPALGLSREAWTQGG